jgi:hypothetical protein
MPDALTSGLNCPRCGGIVPIPEGRVIVQCPYCELRSVVRGERGLRRYQLACRVNQAQAGEALRRFLSGNLAIARDAASKSTLSESFLTFIPFWMAWGRGLGWALGEERVGSGDHKRYEPREVRIVEEMTWNCAACDVGEFGVNRVPLDRQPLDPFQADALHRSGLVFEPAGLQSQAEQASDTYFRERLRQKGKLDRISQFFARVARRRMALVYYPLWMLRYHYRGRAFQVAVDGHSGKVLFGKAPGNTLYRAGVLVGGMALGAFLSVDVASVLLYFLSQSDSDGAEGMLAAAGVALVVGLGLMWAAYRKFRYGEQYEYQSQKPMPGSDPGHWTAALGDGAGELGTLMRQMMGNGK